MSTENPVLKPEEAASVFDRIMEKDTSIPIDPALTSAEPPVITHEETKPVETEEVKEVKQPEVKVEPDEPPEELGNAGRGEQWKKFRASYKEQQKELRAKQEELAAFEGTKKERDEIKAQMAQMTEELSKLKQIDSIVRWENDPEVQRKYGEEKKNVSAQIKELSGYAGVDENEIRAAMQKSGQEKYDALESALSDSNSIVKEKLLRAIDQYETIEAARLAERANVEDSLTKIQAERKQKEEQAKLDYQKFEEETFTKTAAQLSKELGIPAESIDKARKFFFENNDTGKAIEVIIKAHAAETALGNEKQKEARIKELEDQLRQYRESSPGLASGNDAAGNQADANLDFLGAVKKTLNIR